MRKRSMQRVQTISSDYLIITAKLDLFYRSNNAQHFGFHISYYVNRDCYNNVDLLGILLLYTYTKKWKRHVGHYIRP